MNVHIFVGPTLAGQDVSGILPGAIVHPPVAHGDLLRLDLGRGDVVVIIDGYYHQHASVRHKEILALLADGVAVIGCASMGALRAAELAEYGMIGNGVVFGMYRDGVLDADDEVAVAHTPAPEYRSLTVPLVAVRHAVDTAREFGVLDEIDAASIITVARGLHYTERSWQALLRAAETTDSVAGALARLRDFVDSRAEATDITDIKAADSIDTLRKVAAGVLPGDRRPIGSWVSADWHNRYLDEWMTEFSISTVDDVDVSHSDIVRYQQLYDDDFPARWERFVLRTIAGPGDGDADLVERALARAARSGLVAGSLTGDQLGYWLTGREVAELSAEQALLRVLVRSHRPLRPTRDLVDDQPDLLDNDPAARTVAEAMVVNAEVASWGTQQTIDHLKPGALLAHLAQVWRIEPAGEDVLLAAARDRGFALLDDAAEAARMFFLHKSFLNATG